MTWAETGAMRNGADRRAAEPGLAEQGGADRGGRAAGSWSAHPGPDVAGAPAALAITLDLRPTILVAGDDASLADWAERAGHRCTGQIALTELDERLARLVAVDLILVDLRGVAGGLSGSGARALAARHGLDGARLALLTDLDGLDAVMARFDGPDVELFCAPAPSEIISFLALSALRAQARGRQGAQLQDVTRDSEAARLEQLSEEVRRLAMTIDRFTRDEEALRLGGDAVMETRGGYRADAPDDASPQERFRLREHGAPARPDAGAVPTPSEIRAVLRARRMREQFLPADLFADPAWDMMLDLMAARLSGQRVSVSSLCIAAAVPPTTALRWIRQLTDRGVFARIDDPADGRRVFIELTDDAATAVCGWALAVRKNGGLLGSGVRH